MAMKQKKGTTFGIVIGDRGYQTGYLFDKPMMGTGNGTYIGFDTQASRETAIASIAPHIDGGIKNMGSEHGNYTDDSVVRTNDTYGDSSVKAFTVKFSDSALTTGIVIPQVKNTKVTELGTILKGLSYYNAEGVKLTVASVEVKTVI